MPGRLLLAVAVSTAFFACSDGGKDAEPPKPSSGSDLPEVRAYLAIPAGERPEISSQSFATTPLSREDSARMGELFAEQLPADMRGSDLEREYQARAVTVDGETMRFDVQRFGERPSGGHSLFVSMHGGGATPTAVNDEQWENQILRLGDTSVGYRSAFEEGVYVAPRAPTDTWDMWFRGRMDALLDRLIEGALLFGDVDPDRVYLLGYSAGGDGAFRLGPRMADRFAGVQMAAGHPGDADPLNLRNVAFQMQGGKRDFAYERYREIPAFSARLDALREQDPDGYVHQLVMWETGHDFPDYDAVGWLAEHTRNPHPDRVVWRQDGTHRRHFYWLAVQEGDAEAGAVVSGRIAGNRVALRSSGYRALTIRLQDTLVDLDEEISVMVNDVLRFRGRLDRTGETLWRTLHERLDASYMFPVELRLEGL